jgi:O-antigen/teichoic acid export membrane protein
MGLPTLITRETAKAVTLQDWKLLRGVWWWSSRLILIGSALVVTSVTIALAAFPSIISPERYAALLWGVWLIPLLALAAAREAALRGLKSIFLSGLPDQILRPLMLATFVMLAGTLATDALTVQTVMQLALAAAVLAFLLGILLLLRKRPQQMLRSGAVSLKQSQWLRAVIPLTLIVGLQVIRESTDILMLGFWYADADVGIYRIALSIRTVVVFGLVALFLGSQPYIVSAFTVGDRVHLQRIVRIVATLSLLSSLAVAAVIWLEGVAIIRLFYGSVYEAAYAPLAILTAGSVLHAAFGLGGGVLSMTGHEKHVLWASAISIALNVIGNGLLIPSYGALGAATATASSLAAGEVIKYVMARRLLGIDGSIFSWRSASQIGYVRR